MFAPLYKLARPMLFSLDAEKAHNASIRALKNGLVPACKLPSMPRLKTELAGLEFSNPVGLAAGYDKNAEAPNEIAALGFGAVEVGTVTPRPQAGNPKPRVFRLIEREGVINRLGFNNEGHEAVLRRLNNMQQRTVPLGVNIGANKDSEDFVADYISGLQKFWSVADYFTANISSPNTPGLRNLQTKDALQSLLDQLFEAHEAQKISSSINRPVFLKIAPDIDESEMDDIASVVSSSPLDGVIISNTTLNRSTVIGARDADEAGGLSGRPLFERSTIVLAKMRQRLGPEATIIGVGGIDSAMAAWQKMEAGANMVQLYSAMVYHGPGLAGDIVRGLNQMCEKRAMDNIKEVVASQTNHWAEKLL